MLLYTLRGQYEAITSEPDVMFSKQPYFREIWKKAKVFTFWGERIPRWLFLPPSWKDLARGLPLLDMLIDVGGRVIIYCVDSL